MTIDWAAEWPLIRDAAVTYGVDPFFVAAIRQTEGGAAGREFGVLSVPAPTYADQLREACISVRNHMTITMILFNRRAYSAQQVQGFALRWAPPLVANDPTDLNQWWFKNCWRIYSGFCQEGKVI